MTTSSLAVESWFREVSNCVTDGTSYPNYPDINKRFSDILARVNRDLSLLKEKQNVISSFQNWNGKGELSDYVVSWALRDMGERHQQFWSLAEEYFSSDDSNFKKIIGCMDFTRQQLEPCWLKGPQVPRISMFFGKLISFLNEDQLYEVKEITNRLFKMEEPDSAQEVALKKYKIRIVCYQLMAALVWLAHSLNKEAHTAMKEDEIMTAINPDMLNPRSELFTCKSVIVMMVRDKIIPLDLSSGLLGFLMDTFESDLFGAQKSKTSGSLPHPSSVCSPLSLSGEERQQSIQSPAPLRRTVSDYPRVSSGIKSTRNPNESASPAAVLQTPSEGRERNSLALEQMTTVAPLLPFHSEILQSFIPFQSHFQTESLSNVFQIN